MSDAWRQHSEGGLPILTKLYLFVALKLGRNVAVFFLAPITLYFFIFRIEQRRASRAFFTRVQGKPPSTWQVFKHFWTFARVIVDRVYLLSQGDTALHLEAENYAEFMQALDSGSGFVLLGAHFGSFEAGRLLTARRPQTRLRIVLNKAQNPVITNLFDALNPKLAGQVIDVAAGPAQLGLSIAAAVQNGEVVGMLADRVGPNEPGLVVEFLGGTVRLPAAPFVMASLAQAPIAVFFPVFEGGDRYRILFDVIGKIPRVARSERNEVLQQFAQKYADKLAVCVRSHPYNWFNFYPYWSQTQVKPND